MKYMIQVEFKSNRPNTRDPSSQTMHFGENIESANPQLNDKQSKIARNYENNLKAKNDENGRLIKKLVCIFTPIFLL